MAGIVATLLYVPLLLALSLLFRAAGIGFAAFATFGGVFDLFFGLTAWWLILFAGAFVYACFLFPWGDNVAGWPDSK